MRHIRATHPMVYAIDNVIQSGLECIQVVKNSHPSMWDKQATKVGRIIANVEDGWLEAAATFVALKTNTEFTDKDFQGIVEAIQGTHEDLERVHKMLHELTPEVAMEHDRVTMAIEALISLFNTTTYMFKHIHECMIIECGMTSEEKEKSIQLQKRRGVGGPMMFSGSIEDFLRHLRGEDVD